MYYHICPHCGASLDPGETCDCEKKKSRVGGNIKKLLYFFLVFLFFIFSLVGCAKNTPDTKNTPEIQQTHNNDIYEFIDSETGVHYLIYSYNAGYAGMGGITPRLNSDGSIMTE